MTEDLKYLTNYKNYLDTVESKFKTALFERGYMLDSKKNIVSDKEIYVLEFKELYGRGKNNFTSGIYEISKDMYLDFLAWISLLQRIDEGYELTDDEDDDYEDSKTFEFEDYEDEEDIEIEITFTDSDFPRTISATRDNDTLTLEYIRNGNVHKGSKYIFRKGKISEIKKNGISHN